MVNHSDKEYLILSQIDEGSEVSQRELARVTGLSLGTVNLLLKKMVREGLVKMDSIPSNRVVYMLTPQGMVEKARKTVRYVQHHYAAIHETRRKVREALQRLSVEFGAMYVLVPPNELGELVRLAVTELELPALALIHKGEDAREAERPVVHCLEDDELVKQHLDSSPGRPVINLLERM